LTDDLLEFFVLDHRGTSVHFLDTLRYMPDPMPEADTSVDIATPKVVRSLYPTLNVVFLQSAMSILALMVGEK